MVEGVVDWISRSEKRGKQSSGTASFSYQVKATDRGFEILGETSSILSRHIESIKGNAPRSIAPKSTATETIGASGYAIDRRDRSKEPVKPLRNKLPSNAR
jgi:hypothetical protein